MAQEPPKNPAEAAAQEAAKAAFEQAMAALAGLPTMAARVGDPHACPQVVGIIPHTGVVIAGPGVATVMIGYMPAAVEGDTLDPQVETDYLVPIEKHAPKAPGITRIDRFAFYDRAREAYAVLMTGELAKYGNIILKKGVTPVG